MTSETEIIAANIDYTKEGDEAERDYAFEDLIEWDPDISYTESIHESESTEINHDSDAKSKIPPDRPQSIVANIIEMYQCTLCSYVTRSVDNFIVHHKYHTYKFKAEQEQKQKECLKQEAENKREMFLCGQCSAIFETMHLCRQHMIKDHNFQEVKSSTDVIESNIEYEISEPGNTNPSPINDQCAVSDYAEDEKETWLEPITLRELKSRLLKTFIYKCTLKGCFYKFETIEKRDKHILCHISKDFDKVRDFKCFNCGEVHKKWRDTTKHMWKSHQIDVDLLKCPLCDYKSLTSILIHRHIQIHGTVKGFVCSVCSKVFSQASQLRIHSTTHLDKESKNSNSSRWYSQKTCKICNHVFSNSKTLSKHIKVVHNKIKPFICSVCGHKTARKSSLTIHMRQHTGDKPYKCRFCEFTARDPSGLRKHEICHSTENPYKCKLCGYRSAQSNGLKKHFQLVHLDEYKKTMSCDLCKFISVNAETLRLHKEDHKSGLIINEDSNETADSSPKNLLKRPKTLTEKPNANVEISSDSFLPLESTDSMTPLDTGGVTIPATHSEDTQFPTFTNS